MEYETFRSDGIHINSSYISVSKIRREHKHFIISIDTVIKHRKKLVGI